MPILKGECWVTASQELCPLWPVSSCILTHTGSVEWRQQRGDQWREASDGEGSFLDLGQVIQSGETEDPGCWGKTTSHITEPFCAFMTRHLGWKNRTPKGGWHWNWLCLQRDSVSSASLFSHCPWYLHLSVDIYIFSSLLILFFFSKLNDRVMVYLELPWYKCSGQSFDK